MNFIFHIPHSSDLIPADVRSHFSLTDQQLFEELRLMTDWFTSDLFSSAVQELGVSIEFPISRLVVDPERFEDDAKEIMIKKGMGVLYTQTSSGTSLRDSSKTIDGYRDALLQEYYYPHHAALASAVNSELDEHGRALIIDCHSYPNIALPYELNRSLSRPDICVGTDPFHTPKHLSGQLLSAFRDMGYSAEYDTPFSGSIVPTEYYGENKDVHSVMIEVNRSLYLNESTAEKLDTFGRLRSDIASVLGSLSR